MSEAVAHLCRGGLLIYPTETAYALGCDATDARAVRALFRLKGRERGKPLPLIVASRAMVERYAHLTPLARRLAARYWPGALTIVLPQLRHSEGRARGISHHGKVAALAPGIVSPDGSIALRISSHPIARALSQRLGRPIVSTSANRSGQPPCYTIPSALHSLNRTVIARAARYRSEAISAARLGLRVLDIGPLPRRRPSTIVDARGDALRTLRRGTIRV